MKGLRGAARAAAMKEQGKRAAAQKVVAQKNKRRMGNLRKKSPAGKIT